VDQHGRSWVDHHARPWVDQLERSWWITYRAPRHLLSQAQIHNANPTDYEEGN